MSGRMWFVVVVLVVIAVSGCDVAFDDEGNLGPGLPPGARRWVVTVRNDSPRLATLTVSEDEVPIGAVVGSATPNVVPPGATVDVTFVVPSGTGWAIFVNPGPERGPLVVASDVPANAAGRMPFNIGVGASGDPYAEVPGPALPGWFGN